MSKYQVAKEAKQKADVSRREKSNHWIERRRVANKESERARRTRLHAAIAELGRILPSSPEGTSKLNILRNAIEYIQSLESRLAEIKGESSANRSKYQRNSD